MERMMAMHELLKHHSAEEIVGRAKELKLVNTGCYALDVFDIEFQDLWYRVNILGEELTTFEKYRFCRKYGIKNPIVFDVCFDNLTREMNEELLNQ